MKTLAIACLCAVAVTATAAVGADDTDLRFPTRDDLVVEQLPTHLGDAAQRRAARAAERAQRDALAHHPDELGLALQAAWDALGRGRLRGDPRELGVAEAALAPWWNQPEPPPAVRLVRATVRQSQHDFSAALVDLDALLADAAGTPPPLGAQALLTRAGVQQVLGHLDLARADCRRLAGPAFVGLGAQVHLHALACLAELDGLQGQDEAAAATLARLAGAPDAHSAAAAAGTPAPAWLDLMRAELAQRRGDPAAGALFAAALSAVPDVYTLCADADWLLEQHRPADALALLAGHEAADPALLRIAIALRRLHGPRDPRTVAAVTQLGERFDASLLRGDRSHGREQSRFEWELRGDARAALALAQRNWSVQHEPADALALVDAARAAHRAGAAAPVWAYLEQTGGHDVRLPDPTGRAARRASQDPPPPTLAASGSAT